MFEVRLGRAVAVLGCAFLLLAGSLPGYADTESDKSAVEDKLDRAEQDLHRSSKALDEAAESLRRAENELSDARDRLASVEGQVKAAQAKERTLRTQWKRAKARLAESEERLAEAVRRIEEQREQIGAFASANYRTGGGLRDLAVILDSGSPTDLADRMQYVRTIGDGQSAVLEELNAARAEQAAQKAAVARLTARAEERREQAVEQLERQRALQDEAREAADEVRALVDERAEAKRTAEREKDADLERYRELEAERDRIERLLAERAREQEREQEREQNRRSDSSDSSDGSDSSSSGMIMPVGGPITSGYGMRLHPVLGYEKLHDGTDFGVACGTPVSAAASGTVVDRYFNEGYGNRVIVDHGGGLATTYNHLSAFAVSAGERVAQGQVIGYVGTTGYSTGCHLHFMVLRNGAPVDPIGYLP